MPQVLDFALDDWARLDRFLYLGASAGRYRVAEHSIAPADRELLRRCLEADGPRVVRRIVAACRARAPRATPLVSALALAAGEGDPPTRTGALGVLNDVCREPEDLFRFVDAVKDLRGWGRGLKNAVANWYLARPLATLVRDMARRRDGAAAGWTHRDLLRVSHPSVPPDDLGRAALFQRVVRPKGDGPLPEALAPYEAAQRLRRIGDAAAAARLIAEHKLACDCVPARLLEAPEVWQALLADMSVPALLRSLGKMAALGLLRPSVAVARTVAERLLDARLIKRSRVHPVAIVHALAAVQEGGSVDSAIPDALQRAFLAALANVVPTGKRLRLVVDAAGLTDAGAPRLAAAALLTIAARVEKEATFFAFAETPARLPISARSSLAAVLDTLQTLQPRRLDCARPIHAAQAARDPVDAFVVISGDAPAYGDVHPARALESYRQAMGIATRFAAISLTAREFALADPGDRGMLDVIGFDATVPGVVADFVAGRI